MPRMDGITFLKKLMAVRPTPVVVCSTLTDRGAETTMQAMSAGAVTCISKPRSGLKAFLENEATELVRAVKSAAASDMHHAKATAVALDRMSAHSSATPAPASVLGHAGGTTALPVTTERLVAIGTSTGGAQALELVLSSLPRLAAGIVIVQHMPEKFTAAFANRMDSLCSTEVLEASNGDRVLPGRALIAPGGRHMAVERDGAQYRVRVTDGPPVNRHRPSVDVLFQSVARHAGRNALGIIMTGMGDDGARGLGLMREAGAQTIGQDETTCVVYGMPQAAKRLGAVQQEVPLSIIPQVVQRFAREG
jgi:two-component system chemotaxis response regulator CheB